VTEVLAILHDTELAQLDSSVAAASSSDLVGKILTAIRGRASALHNLERSAERLTTARPPSLSVWDFLGIILELSGNRLRTAVSLALIEDRVKSPSERRQTPMKTSVLFLRQPRRSHRYAARGAGAVVGHRRGHVEPQVIGGCCV